MMLTARPETPRPNRKRVYVIQVTLHLSCLTFKWSFCDMWNTLSSLIVLRMLLSGCQLDVRQLVRHTLDSRLILCNPADWLRALSARQRG